MWSGLVSQNVEFGHGVEMDGAGRGVVAPVARLNNAAFLQKRQGHGRLRERQVLKFDQRLECERLTSKLVDGVGHLLKLRTRATVLVGLAASWDNPADQMVVDDLAGLVAFVCGSHRSGSRLVEREQPAIDLAEA